MKRSNIISSTSVLLCLISSMPISGQVNPSAEVQLWQGWTEVTRDECSTTREQTNWVCSAKGDAIPDVHRIIEVASGLNFLTEDGSYQSSSEQIEIDSDGSAKAIRGPIKAYFKPTLSGEAPVTIISRSNRVFTVRPVAIYYVDSKTGGSITLAEANRNAVAELYPPNQIIYKSAFVSKAIIADLRLTYTKAGIESDVILTHQPERPERFFLDPASTQIQVKHIWKTTAVPQKDQRMLGVGMIDQTLEFGDLWMPTGRAYAISGESTATPRVAPARMNAPYSTEDAATIPVLKDWMGTKDGGILTESVSWSTVQPMLTALPAMADSSTITTGDGTRAAAGSGTSIGTATAPYDVPGLVMDYIIVSGSGAYHFGIAGTFLISGPTYFGGLVEFDGRSFIKYASTAFLQAYGDVACYAPPCCPTVMTSADENVFGEMIPGSTGSPSYSAWRALWLYHKPTNPTLVSGLKIRWASTGICLDYPSQSCLVSAVTVTNCSIEMCQIGVYASYCNVLLQNSAKCTVTTDYSGFACFSGSLANLCTGNSDNNAFPDSWEYQYFGHVGVNPNEDSDGDCTSNLQEFSSGTNPVGSPAFTLEPTYQVVQVGGTASFSCVTAQACLSYEWTVDSSPGVIKGTSTTLTIQNVQYSDAGTYTVTAKAPYADYYGYWNDIKISRLVRLVVVDSFGWNNWINFINNTNGKSDRLWDTYYHLDYPPSNTVAPQLAWKTSCLLYGKTGFTGVSQCNSFQGSTGQLPVTALTRRHGYLRGHDNDGNQVGKKVWFCTADNVVVEATIASSTNRYAGGYDYGLVFFSQDLPSTIAPLSVGLPPSHNAVLFCPEQLLNMDANCPPFYYGDRSRPPFNNYDIRKGGDSGSPNMVLTSDNRLVFIGGRTTSGPSSQMQADMDVLTVANGLNPANYQMTWVSMP